jgi:hypothetical protein
MTLLSVLLFFVRSPVSFVYCLLYSNPASARASTCLAADAALHCLLHHTPLRKPCVHQIDLTIRRAETWPAANLPAWADSSVFRSHKQVATETFTPYYSLCSAWAHLIWSSLAVLGMHASNHMECAVAQCSRVAWYGASQRARTARRTRTAEGRPRSPTGFGRPQRVARYQQLPRNKRVTLTPWIAGLVSRLSVLIFYFILCASIVQVQDRQATISILHGSSGRSTGHRQWQSRPQNLHRHLYLKAEKKKARQVREQHQYK